MGTKTHSQHSQTAVNGYRMNNEQIRRAEETTTMARANSTANEINAFSFGVETQKSVR